MAFPVGPADPRLKSATYKRTRAQLKREAKARGDCCARCRGAIDYDGPYWLSIGGRRRVNPRAFVAGHRVGRADGGGDELANLQAECARCSIDSGAKDGSKRAHRRPRAHPGLVAWSDPAW